MTKQVDRYKPKPIEIIKALAVLCVVIYFAINDIEIIQKKYKPTTVEDFIERGKITDAKSWIKTEGIIVERWYNSTRSQSDFFIFIVDCNGVQKVVKTNAYLIFAPLKFKGDKIELLVDENSNLGLYLPSARDLKEKKILYGVHLCIILLFAFFLVKLMIKNECAT